MNKILIPACTIVFAALLAACSPEIHGITGYNMDFRNGQLVLHAPGRPDATVSANGGLRIGDHTVAVTPSQRALLKDYFSESKVVMEASIATGKAGAKFGTHAAGNAIKSIFTGDSEQVGQPINAKAQAIAASAERICTGIRHLHASQRAITAQLPEFKPYDAVGTLRCETTVTHTITVSDGSRDTTRVIKTETKTPAH